MHIVRRLQRIWSRTPLIPGLPVPHFLSPWTNDPHKIDPPGQTVPIKFSPQKFGPQDKWSANQFGPHISGSPQSVPWTIKIF